MNDVHPPTRSGIELALGLMCVAIGALGIGLNLALPELAMGWQWQSSAVEEAVFGILVWVSMGMMGVGYVPAFRKWFGCRWMTVAMGAAMTFYVVYTLVIVAGMDS